MTARPLSFYVICANVFVVGAVLMGFEMLGSRYLVPYFGGGINTWAGLISVVLCGLAIGYLVGGALVDRDASPRMVGIPVAIAALYLAMVPPTVDHILRWVMDTMGYGAVAILFAASVLLLAPFSLLGILSPAAVRLMIRSTQESGRVAGIVYGVSTIGNVLGVLLTTFWLIPTIGVRPITLVYAALLAICALSLLMLPRNEA
ncbi:MAG TPA: fused MFS/spermidine synthase [Verrucomicrobiae bacterium]|nr:fused MFS/spermidine synthase [Verrucomicrobiae bacterium]